MQTRPADSTLAKYGLSLEEWETMYREQGERCGVCMREARLVVDHEHVKGYKMMRAEDRKKYVRGLCCTTCNHFVLTRYADAKKHEQAAAYLRRYEKRRHS